MRWTEGEIKKAIELLENGSNYYHIGETIGRTEKSVKEKLSKLGYKRIDHIDKDAFYSIGECVECGKEFKSLTSKQQKFCGQSCSAKHNNKLRGGGGERLCKKCGLLITGKHKHIQQFCSRDCYNLDKFETKLIEFEKDTHNLSSKICKLLLKHLRGEKCEQCSWAEINPTTNKIPIELDHIDGNHENNHKDNLRLLCPNCHSLTPTYKALNKGNGRKNRK